MSCGGNITSALSFRLPQSSSIFDTADQNCQELVYHSLARLTLAFGCGARSASELREKNLLEKHAIAPSAARLCYARRQWCANFTIISYQRYRPIVSYHSFQGPFLRRKIRINNGLVNTNVRHKGHRSKRRVEGITWMSWIKQTRAWWRFANRFKRQ